MLHTKFLNYFLPNEASETDNEQTESSYIIVIPAISIAAIICITLLIVCVTRCQGNFYYVHNNLFISKLLFLFLKGQSAR